MGMKIEIELPDWCGGRHVRIFAGIELVARSMIGVDGRKPMEIKKVRCNKCGQCCMGKPGTSEKGYDPETGWCLNLKKTGSEILCDVDRPFSCCAASPSDKEFCVVEWGNNGC